MEFLRGIGQKKQIGTATYVTEIAVNLLNMVV